MRSTSGKAEATRSLGVPTPGETIGDAVTAEVGEHRGSERAQEATKGDMPARVAALVARLGGCYDTRPVAKAEWDAACGDDA